MAKTYLNADPEKSNPENKILLERIETPEVNSPIFLTHDIFFTDDFLLYIDPQN